MAIVALLGAVRVRVQSAPGAGACTSYIYWESPLLK